MSTLQTSDSIVAILLADIHLSLVAPVCRSGEPDWFSAMERPLREIGNLARKYGVPIICAGDVFDRSNSTPKLINFALDILPKMYAIPGQHDLPMHRYDLMDASAFGTLHRAGKIVLLDPGEFIRLESGIWVQGFPWGTPLVSLSPRKSGGLKMAVVHSFIWVDEKTGYPGVSEEKHLRAMKGSLQGWDVVVFGDNHQGFRAMSGGTGVFNCGGLFRRRKDEVDYRPQVGLLHESGAVDSYYLDVSQDVFDEGEVADWDSERESLARFVGALETLTKDPLDFREAMKQVMDECDSGVRDILIEVMNEQS